MPYVSRENGAISGLFANLQPGFAEEFLPDDNAEVVAHKQGPIDAKAARLAREAALKSNADYSDLVGKLKTSTIPEWQSYVTSNTVGLPIETRTLLYKMGLALMALARQLP